jgi:hypothetical protein
MKVKSLLLTFFVLACELTIGQSYFDLFYTNIPKSKFSNYSIASSNALGWIQTGNYAFPSECSNCFDYTRDSKLKKEKLDSLVFLYKESGISKIYSKQYVPNNHYFVIDKKTTTPYIIKTLYRIEKGSATPVQQIKTIFYERPGKTPGILNAEIMDLETMKIFDSKIVLTSYQQKLKLDSEESGPQIQN